MVTGIIGRKVGMTQLFDKDGTVQPATVLKAGPCVVVQAKNAQSDGYQAVQLGLVEEKAPKVNKAIAGHYKKANVPPTRVRREVKVAKGAEAPKAGEQVLVGGAVCGRRAGGRDCDQPRPGLPGRGQAPPLRRRRGDARLDVPSGAGLHWRQLVSVAGHQGHAGGRATWAAGA